MNIINFFSKNKFMEKFKNICFYLSSFIPLYFLIIIKELLEIVNGNLTFNITNSIMLSINLLMIVFGIVGFVLNFKSKNYSEIEIIDYKNVTCTNFFPYFPLFVLFALAFELQFISMSVVYLLIILMVGIVYVKNELFYVNPFLNIIGFSTYELTYLYAGRKQKTFVFSFSQLKNGKAHLGTNFVKVI